MFDYYLIDKIFTYNFFKLLGISNTPLFISDKTFTLHDTHVFLVWL